MPVKHKTQSRRHCDNDPYAKLMIPTQKFWPRYSPNFAAVRAAARSIGRSITADELVVGVSGGADSMALAAALVAEGFLVHAVCVDHGLQEGSFEVAEQAMAQLHKIGAICHICPVDIPAGGNLEAKARSARYAALHSFGLPVAVAHTKDDQAETFLLSALRGNATGMQAETISAQGKVLRPLLGIRRAQTMAACAELGFAIWDDPHNQDLKFRRVAIRNQVLPVIAELTGGDPIPALAQAATNAVEDDGALQTAATNDCATLEAMGKAQRRRAIAAWLHENHAPVTGEGLKCIDALVSNWHGQGPVAIGGRLEVTRKSGKLSVNDQKGQP